MPDPIVINTLQLRLAMELAAQYAARQEIERQAQTQLPGLNVIVEGAEIDILPMDWPEFEICGRQVIWE